MGNNASGDSNAIFDSNSVAFKNSNSSGICNLYKSSLDDLMRRYSVQESEVTSSLSHLVSNYKRVSNGQIPQGTDFNNLSCCIGYLHRYAVCHTCLVHNAMTAILHTPLSAEINALLMKSKLNVVFLGGGPGNDFVGFLSALWGKHGNLTDMDVTVMDKMAGWRTVFNETMEKLRKGDCGRPGLVLNDVHVTTSFMEVDLINSQTWDSEIKTKFENADAIFLVKFLSHVPDGDKLNTVKNVVQYMRSNSLLVYIDGPFPDSVFRNLCLSYLDTIYELGQRQYNFSVSQITRFGFPNIHKCKATVQVFVKR